MAKRITYVPNRVIDTDGISDGASIYVYQTGGTTLVDIYSDEALTTPLPNPYVVVAGAAVPVIYYNETSPIRVRVVEADGTPVQDDDPYATPVTDADLASTDAGKGAALVGYAPSETGGQSRTALARFNEDEVRLEDFKASGDADYYNAFVNAFAALTARGGGTLRLPRGNVNVASATLGTTGITFPSNVELRGHGKTASSITVTGASVCNLFVSGDNLTGVAMRDFTAIGNNVAFGTISGIYNQGAFFNCVLTSTSTANGRNYVFKDIHLKDFTAPWWLCVQNKNATYRMKMVRVEDLTFATSAGNAAFPEEISVNSVVLAIVGNGLDSPVPTATEQYVVENVLIDGLEGDATHVKTGLLLFHQIQNAICRNIKVRNAGTGAAFVSNDKGVYAVYFYDNTGRAFNVTLDGFDCSAKSVPVYVAGGHDVTITNGRAHGQTDTTDTSLPKGGLVFNGTIRPRVKNVYLYNNARAHLAISGPSIAEDCDAVFEGILTDATAEQGLRIRMVAAQPLTGLTVRDCRFSGSTYGATIWHDPDEVLRDLTIQNSYFNGGTYGIDAFVLSGAANDSGDWLIEDSEFSGATGTGFRLRNLNNPIIFRRNKAYLSGTAVCFEIRACLGAKISDLDAETGSGGVAYQFTDLQGTIDGYMRVNSGASTKVSGLGAAKPTHSGKKGDFVKAVNFTVAAAGAAQTYEKGWLCEGTTTWRAVVETVNAA